MKNYVLRAFRRQRAGLGLDSGDMVRSTMCGGFSPLAWPTHSRGQSLTASWEGCSSQVRGTTESHLSMFPPLPLVPSYFPNFWLV